MSEDIKSLSDLDVVSSENTAAVEVAAPRVAVRDADNNVVIYLDFLHIYHQ